MSDPDLDELAQSARNRGLKLVRSRVRTAAKRRFGKVGLRDAQGKAVFGMDDKGPAATPGEVADYLRALGTGDWKASLGATRVRKRKRVPEPEPEPPAKAEVRAARRADAKALDKLIGLLGAEFDTAGLTRRLAALLRTDASPLVATLGPDVIGLCGLHVMPALHRDRPVGRINLLVVAEEARGLGVGRMLVEASIERLRALGCGVLEVTSNDRLTEAHAFYRHLGFEQTSRRFCLSL